MSTPDRLLSASETLAAATSTLPPDPPTAPLGTTLEDVHGVTLSKATSQARDLPHMDDKPEQQLSGGAYPPENSIPALPKGDEEALDPELPQEQLSPARLVAIAGTAMFTMLLSAMGNSALNIALPTIQTDLGMQETDLQWIASAYALTNGCFLLLAGRLADVHGRKLVFLCGIAWYGLWTMVGPFFPNGAGLVVSRALTGCGAAMA